MLISTKGRYALRVMLELSDHDREDYVPLSVIAKKQEISEKYLESILVVLSKAGAIDALRGKGGGYRLNRAPKDYTIGGILRLVEGSLAPVSCLTEDGKKCGGVCTCYTLPFWRGLEEHINAYIDGYTLRDLLDAKRNTPVCGGTGDADTNSAEKKDTEQ